ncbi:MAG: DNA primase [Alphaproteobacteria bacterium]|jgi:DNA primase|nr:DNA primase [Alphaproteobacteria bacterium]
MSDLAPFLQTLRDRLTITEVIRPHVKLTRKGRESTGLCPFHKEKSPSFTVSDEKGFYHCFGCGAHGDIFDFVMQKQNMPFMEAVEMLANLLGLEIPKLQADSLAQSSQPKPDASLYEVMEAACCWYQQQLTLSHGEPARTYFEQRGLESQTIAQWRLGYAPEQGLQKALEKKGFSEALMIQAGLIGRAEERNTTYDRFRTRLMFPIWDGKGRVIAFGGRILKEGDPKYLNSPDTPTFIKGKTLYAYNFALPIARQKDASGEGLIVVEGYMDVIAMHQAGFTTAVAPLGTALTHDQMALLWRGTEDPILCFDGDAAGTRAAHRAAEKALGILKVGQTLRFCFLPAGEDPDSLLRSGRKDAFRQILSSPQPLVDVLWSIFQKGRLFQTPEQKAKARQDLGELMKEIGDLDVRHFYREELNNRLQALTEPKGRDQGSYAKGYDQGKYFKKSSINSISSAGSSLMVARVSPNKNHLGHKILLATLINHPTLVEDTAESLQLLADDAVSFDEMRQAILSIVADNPTIHATELQELLKQQGFAALLAEVLTPQVYSFAPFAKVSSTYEEALAGWKEVWYRTVAKHYLAAETHRTAAAVRDQFDEETWERFKFLKNQVVFKKDEKRGV